jgi:hypothetical protein
MAGIGESSRTRIFGQRQSRPIAATLYIVYGISTSI